MMTETERFEQYVERSPTCWFWRGAACRHTFRENPNVRGRFRFRGKVEKAHRVAYTLYVGEIPAKRVVRHTCDNALCVNPAHLELGTQQDNVRDMYARGRR